MVGSVHACKLSPDQSLLFTANRGLNHISIDDDPSNAIRLRVKMPDTQAYLPSRGMPIRGSGSIMGTWWRTRNR